MQTADSCLVDNLLFSNMSKPRNTKQSVVLYFVNTLGSAEFTSGQKEKTRVCGSTEDKQIQLTRPDLVSMLSQQVHNPFYVTQTPSFNSHK